MKIHDLINGDLLNKHLNNGMVSVQVHPDHPYLQILNYTHKAQYEPAWGDGTIDCCRGLIFDAQNGEIIARPFKKFHNLNTASIPETLEANLPKTTPKILKKYDGSLGILWQYDDDYGIATRGSFTSPQAQWATKWLKDRVEGRGKHWGICFPASLGTTWLFEIIYRENQIVVHYPTDDLVVLALIDNKSGEEYSHQTTALLANRKGFSVAEEIKGKNIYDLLLENHQNEEGYVVSYSAGHCDPIKVKIKFED